MSIVTVNTYAYSVTHVTDNILRCLQDIVRESGLSPSKIAADWDVLERGLKRWIETQDLQAVVLEVYNPTDNALIGRWDFEIFYGYNGGDGTFYVDTDQIKFAVRKAGVWPSDANYVIIATTKPGRPEVSGWGKTSFRSTAGFVKQSIGTTIEGSGLSAGAHYYRRI